MKRKELNQKPDHCQNCSHPIGEGMDFCPNCGQKALPEHLTLKYFIYEFLNNYFSFDSKFFNTIRPLIVKPAFLSLEFIEGRRIRYINPIQLFVFISFLYFLVDSFMILKENQDGKDYVVMGSNGNKVNLDSLDIELNKQDGIDILKKDKKEKKEDNSLIHDFTSRALEFNALDKDEQNERISKMISYCILILTPLFALLLGWLFKNRKRHYLENLIFSLHFHSFYFLLGIIFMLIDRLIPESIDFFLWLTLLVAYLLIALKKFYTYKLKATVFRFFGLISIYSFFVLLCYISSVVISILL